MAKTEEGQRLTSQYRESELSLRALVLRDLARLWRGVDPTNLEGTIRPFVDAATLLIRERYGNSVGLASRYFREFRQAEGISGTVAIVTPEPPPRDVTAGVIRGAALSGIINARRAGFPVAAAADNGFVKVSGSTSNLVLSGGRGLVSRAAESDRRARGWQRVESSSACDWCKKLEARGPVYSQQSAFFEAHDHCGGTAEPVY